MAYHCDSFDDLYDLILFENLFKPRQLPSTTSKQCFEQPAASFLVCSLIFIEYKNKNTLLGAGCFA
ncbi:hypothetical protein PNI0008_00790 [Streptococcus pneumoniae PNI0008]|nr:hypothetical protein PCS81218_00275 [Streptococcus pneumoniae PCS81218]ELU72846.1 hypothetical protein PNI0008_00790 [Streptococcus pneumoniae PNI0008]ELU81347.1 hypothetical protein PNI0009_01070 [Streptococcus pneumoniae PNI0009]ELU84234.1 hypothetical protein PNI0199_01818 [Streptococcus pneumoniae PNI0199]ELU87836.1 hypothetical protein PNI0360_01226 [Streptococcus pneumoniae PNI0360]ELU88890.1 hypothetical protein PNI0427_01752 [Streptococcus pneumoniae PNI0427]ELU93369.1 hypothetical